MPDSSYFQGPVSGSQTDAVTVVSGSSGSVGLFKCYTTTAVAGAIAGTSSVPLLYNPPGSGVVLRIMAVRFGAVAGTVIAACITYGVQSSPVLTVLTAGPTPINCFIGRGATFAGNWYTTATIGAAPTILFPNGISAGGAYAAGPLFTMMDPVNGSIVIPPACAFWPYLSNAALAMTALITVDVLQTPFLAGY
jgi:hypothetical protein